MPTFVTTLKREVGHIATQFKISPDRAFLIWFAQIALELTPEDALEATSYDGANDKSIDLFYIDKEAAKVIIAQSTYHHAGQHRPSISKVNGLLQCISWLRSPADLRNDGKANLAGAAEEFNQALNEGYAVELWFVYAGPTCANVERHIAVYNKDPDNQEASRSCTHCPIGLLETMYEESIGKVTRIESERILLVDGQHFEYSAEFGESLVCTVPANELVRIYRKYEDKLFERNVRLFLGAKRGSINAGIAETLRSPKKSNFWAYNNGITLVCSKFTPANNSVTVEQFCIVNGCQSTRSLVDNDEKVDSSVNVLVRVLAVANELVDDVIRYTNSQNPIRPWDLASQFKTQRRLKKEFKERLAKPWIYLTRRGDKPSGSLHVYKNGGGVRQIKTPEIGQYVAAIAGHAVLAYKDKALIFRSRHDTVFPHDIKVEEVLFAWICGQEVIDLLRKQKKDSKHDAEFDEQEKRILTKGGSIFTLAVLGEIARLRNGQTFSKQLDEEQITSKRGKARIRKYAEYAVLAYLSAVRDAAESTKEELPTLIRSDDFYSRVRARVKSQYQMSALSKSFLNDVLPKLIQPNGD